MFTLFTKIIVALFFGYIAIDSFYKMKKIKFEIKEDLLNPTTGRILKNRALRTGVIFLIMSILSFASIWLKVTPLGE